MSQLLLRRFSGGNGGGHCRRLSSAAGSGARRGPPLPQQQLHEEGSREVKVSVWWDFENCHVPIGVNVCRVAPRVTAALRAAGIRGPLSITAFGDVLQLSRTAQEALAATGVSISHVPNNGKNSSDRSFMADLVYWIAQNPPPAHFFLISGDKDFANVLHRLRMSNYNILLACPSKATGVLCSAATIMWPWEALVKGLDFSPKRFNHPPDGLYGSWYGDYKGALDNPFMDKKPEEPIVVPSDSKPCPIPKYVVDGIQHTLSSYPNGVSLSQLRVELRRNNVNLGSDFFGHKKFSCLIQSMPQFFEFIDPPSGEDQPFVVGVGKLEPAEQSSKTLSSPQSNIRDNDLTQATDNNKTPSSSVPTFCSEQNSKTLNSPRSIARDRSFPQIANENRPTFSVSSSQSDALSSSIADLNADPESPANHKKVEARTSPGTPSSSVVENTFTSNGFLRRISIFWNGPEAAKPDVSPHCESTSAKVDDLRTKQDYNADQVRRLLKRTHKTSSQNGSSDRTDCTTAVTANVSKLYKDDHSEKLMQGDGFLRRIWIFWNGPEAAKLDVSPRRESTSTDDDDLRTTQQDHSADQGRRLLKSTCKTSSQNGSSDRTDFTTAVTANVSKLSKYGHSEKLMHGEEMGTLKHDLSNLQKSESCPKPASVPDGKAGKMDDISKKSEGFFSWATAWWKHGKSDADSDKSEQNGIDVARTNLIEESKSLKAPTCGNQQVLNVIFTKPYLWDILEQQLSKPFGSELVSKAKTREELANGLQKLDCWPLKGLSEKDLNQLVHLLLLEKKWIEENPSRYFPFRLILPQKRTCVPSNSSKFDGLSSIFSNGKALQQGKCVGDESKANMSLTREEILSDCHELLKELLPQHGSGFTIGIFKRHFAQKYGYELDHEKLGYPDLKSLLQIMPDVRIKFPCILPLEDGNDHAGSKANGNHSNGEDFSWEELGPVSASAETAEAVDKEMCYQPPTPSDDEFSDENEPPADPQPRRDTEPSSLLQIIDSWNSNKDDSRCKKPREIDAPADCSRSNAGHLGNLMAGTALQKPTRGVPHKQYSFVSDSEDDEEKDKLVESVLGSLQKARGSKLQN